MPRIRWNLDYGAMSHSRSRTKRSHICDKIRHDKTTVETVAVNSNYRLSHVALQTCRKVVFYPRGSHVRQ